MTHPTETLLCESLDEFAWDPGELRGLLPTTPLRIDEDGWPTGDETEPFLDLDATTLRGRSW
jgi:hypothetical protein